METSQDFPFQDLEHPSWPSLGFQRSRASRWGSDRLNTHALYLLEQLRRNRPRSFTQDQVSAFLRFLDTYPVIFYEVLAHLHPLDLYNLAHTSVDFRVLVTAKGSRRLWDVAYRRNPPIPGCPADMHPMIWANLLFGVYVCQDCGDYETQPNMLWRRRLCFTCKTDRSLETMRTAELPNISESIDIQKLFNPEEYMEVQEVAEQLGAYTCARWDTDKAERCLEQLQTKSATMDIVTSIRANANNYIDWYNVIEGEILAAMGQKMNGAIRIVKPYLKKRGYNGTAINHIFDVVQGKPILRTKVSFDRSPKAVRRYVHHNLEEIIQPLQKLLDVVSRHEAKKRYAATFEGRGDAIKKLWRSYLKSTQCLEESEAPDPGLDILSTEPFASMVVDPKPGPINKIKTYRVLASFADKRTPLTLEDLYARQLPKIWFPDSSPPHNFSINSAASVFVCMECTTTSPVREKCCLGWTEVLKHIGGCFAFDPRYSFKFSQTGCEAALNLLKVLGVDPRTTRVEDVVGEANFVCRNCIRENGAAAEMGWRACIIHSIELGESQTHSTPAWDLVTPSEGSNS